MAQKGIYSQAAVVRGQNWKTLAETVMILSLN